MGNGTVFKVIQVIRMIAEEGVNWNIRDLSVTLEIPRSTLHRILKTLTQNDILTFDPSIKKYHWGPVMIRIAQSVYQKTEMRELALPILRSIVNKCNETAILTLYQPESQALIFADQVQCEQTILYQTRIGVKLPVHAGASGKAILAFLGREEIESIVSLGLEKVTERTITEPVRVMKELAKIRRNGYAISHGERNPEAVGIAAPFFDANARVVGSILVTIPSYRFRAGMEKDVRDLVKEGAAKLSYLNGFHQAACLEIRREKV